jgi:hypothetical protein
MDESLVIGLPSGKRLQFAIENVHLVHWFTHAKLWFSIVMLNLYRRVYNISCIKCIKYVWWHLRNVPCLIWPLPMSCHTVDIGGSLHLPFGTWSICSPPIPFFLNRNGGRNHSHYHLVMTNIAMENHHFWLIGKPSINGPSIPWLC